MIRSYFAKDTEKPASGVRVRQFVPFERIAQRKLAVIEAAVKIDDLFVPPGNQLEKLVGRRKGQGSIRINDQCFDWKEDGAYNVEIMDAIKSITTAKETANHDETSSRTPR